MLLYLNVFVFTVADILNAACAMLCQFSAHPYWKCGSAMMDEPLDEPPSVSVNDLRSRVGANCPS